MAITSHKPILVGDIGGTKTILALVSGERGPRRPLVEETFPSSKHKSLEEIVHLFLQQTGSSVNFAAFGVAGPVVRGRASVTNLPWQMEEQEMAHSLGFASVMLLNDLAAIANAIPELTGDDLHTLNEGSAEANGPIGVVAPGTGLGEAYLVHDGKYYHAQESEGGHADFAPRDALECELLLWLLETKYSRVSYERVCSGKGIPNIYNFLKATGRAEEPEELRTQLRDVPDPTPIIVNNAQNVAQRCDICIKTLEMFISILGAEAGNLGLKMLTTGGIYLGGGIPPRILEELHSEPFWGAFTAKGRMSHILEAMPVHVILNAKAALLGAASYGLRNAGHFD